MHRCFLFLALFNFYAVEAVKCYTCLKTGCFVELGIEINCEKKCAVAFVFGSVKIKGQDQEACGVLRHCSTELSDVAVKEHLGKNVTYKRHRVIECKGDLCNDKPYRGEECKQFSSAHSLKIKQKFLLLSILFTIVTKYLY